MIAPRRDRQTATLEELAFSTANIRISYSLFLPEDWNDTQSAGTAFERTLTHWVLRITARVLKLPNVRQASQLSVPRSGLRRPAQRPSSAAEGAGQVRTRKLDTLFHCFLI